MMYKTAKNSTPQQISIKILLLRQETVSCKLFRLMALRHSAFYTPLIEVPLMSLGIKKSFIYPEIDKVSEYLKKLYYKKIT